MLQLPYLKTNISESLYDKQSIINTIENNYNLSNSRNAWDKNYFNPSYLHQSTLDEENTIFEKINYQSIIPVYKDVIEVFLKQLSLNKDVNYFWEICNYTVCSESQFMNYHDHIADCDFFMVHYIQFDKKYHKPTLYKNTHCFANYLSYLRPKMYDSFKDNLENSWLRSEFFIEVDENDVVIVPSAIPHMIPPNKKGTKNRITLVTNIKISS